MVFSNVIVDLSTAQIVIGVILAVGTGIVGYLGLRSTIKGQVISFLTVLQQDNESLRTNQTQMESIKQALEDKIEELREQIDTYIESNRKLSESNQKLSEQLDQVSADLQDCLKFRRSVLKLKEGKTE